MSKLQIELVRSVAGKPKWMRTIVRGMGIRKMHQKVVLPDNGATRGMIAKVPHLVNVTPAQETKNG